MSKIKELPKSSSHLLQCTQIITSVHSVVKELIENAIDSSSKNIEIKLDDYGLDKIEVKDNGSGICKDDIDKVCKPHCTSKLNSHADLTKIQTYGFRGEALAALCAVSDLTITSKTAEEQFGFTYVFEKNGAIVSTKPYPCTQGTTVAASNLFKNIPVRKQYYRTDKNKKEELKKIEDILCAFGCIHTDIRFALFHNKSLIWQKPVVGKVREGLVSIFGSSIVDHMQNCEFSDDKEQVKIEVFLPKGDAPAFCSNISATRSIISINKRPVRMKVIDKVLKQCFSKSLVNLNKSRYPICYISIEVPPAETDVNVEPNKTTVLLHNIDIVTEQLTAILKTFYDSDSSNENYGGAKAKQSDTTSKTEVITLESPLKRSEVNIVSNPAANLTQSLIFPNSQNKYCDRKKSSKPSGLQEPAMKKIRTSNSTLNDIYRHLKTMDSFFATASSTEVGNIDSNSTSLLNNNDSLKVSSIPQVNSEETLTSVFFHTNTTSPLQSEISGASLSQNLTDNQSNKIRPSNSNHHFSSVTAKRKQLSSVTVDNEIMFPKDHAQDVTDLNIISMPEISDNNCHRSGENLIDLNGINSKQISSTVENAPTNGNDNCILGNKDDLSFQTEKSILEKNQNILLNDEQVPCMDKISNNNCLPVSKPTDEPENQIPSKVTDSQNWSRGKHSIENLQPVTVLMPQSIADCPTKTVNNEKIIFKEKTNSPKELINVVQKQRKMTAFDLFCRKHRLEIASLNPEMTNHQIAQILTEKWSNLSVEEKTIYKNMIDKDYPKNVKNKEKLANNVRQNLNKIKGTPTKKKSKIKKKYTERIISLDLQKSHNHSLSCSNLTIDDINVISSIAPGIWIFSQYEKLYILNTFRLQEMIIYHRLLNTFRFEPEKLEFPCIVSNDTLGEAATEFLSQLPKKECYLAETIIDERITANGFEINLLKGQEEIQVQIVGMTKSIAFYSVLDLKEILLLLKEKGPCTKLSECRPGKVILYLQSEAVRMARQFPASKSIDDVKDLLKSKEILPPNCDLCIHSKPFIHEITTLS